LYYIIFTISKMAYRTPAEARAATTKNSVMPPEARDLSISYNSRIGWSITEPTEALIDFIISQGWDDIMMNRQEGLSIRGIGGPGAKGGITPPMGRTSSTRKVVCPCCGQSVRATKKVNILCGDCLLPMVEV